MNFIDTETRNDPLDPSGFDIITEQEYPVCLLGFQLRDSYDQLRLKIDKKYSPRDVVHFSHYPDLTPLFFRGIPLNSFPVIKKLVLDLTQYQFQLMNVIQNAPYRSILEKYDLTCQNCFSLLRSGVYPIDGECLEKITDTKIDVTELYENIYKSKKIPYFQAIGYFTLFVLDNQNIANGTNQKALEKIVNSYKNLPRSL
jgi:hypothetical protein